MPQQQFIDFGNLPYERIEWYEWFYDINENGDIRSYWKRNNRWAELTDSPQILLRPRNKRNKVWCTSVFSYVTLNKWKCKKHYPLWVLVAKAFMNYDNSDKTKQICHIDWDGTNCHISNLYIWTVSERATNHFRPWFLSSKQTNDRTDDNTDGLE